MDYYIIVSSKDHVNVGVEKGFAQAGHGKKSRLAKLKKKDWIIYYSSKDKIENGRAYQKFTAAGQVEDNEPYQVNVSPEFKPWRRNINYYPVKELDIHPLLDKLSFITNRKRWGLHFVSGFIKIEKSDFELIFQNMQIHL